MSTVNSFVSNIPSYNDLLQTVNAIQQLLYQFQAEVNVVIIRHTYPYIVEFSSFNNYFQVHIFTFQGLLYLHNTLDEMLLLPF